MVVKKTSNTLGISYDNGITAREIIVLDQNRQILANRCSLSEAMSIARQSGLNLIQINVQDGVAVCCLEDINIFIYKKKKSTKKVMKIDHKTLNISAAIDMSDLLVKLGKCLKQVLRDGDSFTILLKRIRERRQSATKKGFDGKDVFIPNYFLEHKDKMECLVMEAKEQFIKFCVRKSSKANRTRDE